MYSQEDRRLDGKKGLVLGVANEESIAYGCAEAFKFLGDVAGAFVQFLSSIDQAFFKHADRLDFVMELGGAAHQANNAGFFIFERATFFIELMRQLPVFILQRFQAVGRGALGFF